VTHRGPFQPPPFCDSVSLNPPCFALHPPFEGQTALPTQTSHGAFPGFAVLSCGLRSAHTGAPSSGRASGKTCSALSALCLSGATFINVHASPIAQQRLQTPPQLLPDLVPPEKMQNIHLSILWRSQPAGQLAATEGHHYQSQKRCAELAPCRRNAVKLTNSKK